MREKRPERWADVVPGIVALATAALVAVAVFFTEHIRRTVAEGPALVVLAHDVGGLVPGAEVWLAGKPAGRVRSIKFAGEGSEDPGLVALSIVLRREAGPALRADASVEIGRSALLAPPVVKLSPGTPSAGPFDSRDTLVVRSISDLETLRAMADSGRTALAALSADLDRLRSELEHGSGTLSRMRRDADLSTRGRRRARAAGRLGAAWGAERGNPFSVDLAGTLRQVAAMEAARRPARERLRRAARSGRQRLARLEESLREGRGTAGRATHDGELAAQAERTREQLDSLWVELVARPFDWLKFRLF